MKDERASEEIVQGLLALREAGDEIADSERDHVGDEAAKESASGTPEIDFGAVHIRDNDAEGALANGALPGRAFHGGVVEPADQDKEKEKKGGCAEAEHVEPVVRVIEGIETAKDAGQPREGSDSAEDEEGDTDKHGFV